MQVLEIIAAKRDLAMRVLQDFIANYMVLEDMERMEKSNTIMDELNSYLQIKENLLFRFIREHEEHQDLLDRAQGIHQEINSVSEHAIMMHVDEPSGEYYNDMRRLFDLLELARRSDEEAIFPWARVYLSENDQLYIANHLKNQMVHESLPSSGMTVY